MLCYVVLTQYTVLLHCNLRYCAEPHRTLLRRDIAVFGHVLHCTVNRYFISIIVLAPLILPYSLHQCRLLLSGHQGESRAHCPVLPEQAVSHVTLT